MIFSEPKPKEENQFSFRWSRTGTVIVIFSSLLQYAIITLLIQRRALGKEDYILEREKLKITIYN